MKTVGSREFQLGYQKFTEPVRVESRGKLLGVWFPAESVDATDTRVMFYRKPEGWVDMAHQEEPKSKT